MTIGFRALACLALLALTACGNAAAQTIAPVADTVGPAASVAMVDRLAQRRAEMLPDVTGLTVARARTALDGLQVTVIAFSRGPVTAQWPPAGDPRPADGVAMVWVGTPPTPPPPAPHQAPTAPTATEHLTPTLITPAPEQPGGRTPGLEGMVPPPHPPRSNIREMPPAERGTTLSGAASWYGPGFAGHTTACGGTFDPTALTLASRELRCGTRVAVIGPTGSAVEAVVTDWGPAEWTGRRFDLSQATFAAVAGLGAGVVDVTVEVR